MIDHVMPEHICVVWTNESQYKHNFGYDSACFILVTKVHSASLNYSPDISHMQGNNLQWLYMERFLFSGTRSYSRYTNTQYWLANQMDWGHASSPKNNSSVFCICSYFTVQLAVL